MRVRFDLDLLDVAAVGVDLEVGQDLPPLVIVAMGEFVTGRDGFHPQVAKEVLVVVGAGPAGSTTARFAAEAGASVLMLERRAKVGVPVRCGELMPDLQEMRAMFPKAGDMEDIFEVPPALVSLRFNTIRIFSPKAQGTRCPSAGTPPTETSWTSSSPPRQRPQGRNC